MGLPGVTVTLTGVSGATATTDDSGQYAFTGLRMGSYSVEISGFNNDEVGFSNTAASVSVGVGESKIVSFDGTYLRTAGIMGRVSIEGEGLEGVTVSLAGGPDNADMTTMTDAAGQYSFARLRAGAYAVGISGYDTDDFEFEVTSQNVTVALGETANVPFDGVLLRTSGISGRVSVEGMGLEDITVTLSMADADDMTAMTDAGGLYAFAGLAAGDYTVAIAVESEAYVFESMSMDVTVGDDETAIVNFEGTHARTASVSGRLFIDELMKNDMHDEGEHPLPHAGVPVVLVGPGVNDQMPSATDSTGAYSFMGLKAGDYQLVVPVTGPMGDFAYGGSATGYTLSVGVGEAVTQNIPIDITHTTVHFEVSLKHGEMRGAPLPGAAVTLYADAGGETKVGEGTTAVDDHGHALASIRVARAGTSGNTVHAGVSAEGYHVADGMTAVMWDPQMTSTLAENDNDIVNPSVDVTFSGATVDRGDYGGGDALAGWAVSVMYGDSTLAGDGVPAMLDADGMAAFKMSVESVPAMFTFSVDTIQDNTLDGGENFDATAATYTHTGLTLAGTMDAGAIEVTYTTQTLKVYVHHERDQVHGYTGNVLGGDVRASGMLDVGIRYIADNGRSRTFPASAKIGSSNKDGVYTFTNVPADANVIAVADEAADSLNVMLLDPDELAAYTGDDGATGGMFGDNGGFSHTVELCPLMGPNPSTQDHDECGSFAFVSTYSVSGLVWKRGVVMSGDDFEEKDPVFVAGQTVSLDPVEGKNLAGEAQSQTTTATNVAATPRNDTHQFDFGHIASGVYKLSVPAGWRARMGAKGAEAMLGDALNPLAGDLAIDVTPATATLYGRVNGDDGFPLDSVTVSVNGQTAETDGDGRYIVDGIAPATREIGATTHTNKIFVQASRAGFDDSDVMVLDFASNSVERHDFALGGTAESATVSGTVTAFGSDTPIAGVEIQVDGMAPMNKNAKSVPAAPTNDIYVTGADGTYTIRVPATAVGVTSTISAHKDGFTFTPASLDLSTPKGSAISGINFQGVANSTIRGRVENPDSDGPLSGVAVTATGSNGSDTDTTGVTGTYSLSVPAGTYTLAFSKEGYSFELPEGTTSWDVTVGLAQTVTFAQVESTKLPDAPSDDATLSALSLSDGMLDPAFSSADTMYTANVGVDTDSITVTATATHDSAMVEFSGDDADTVAAGYQVGLMVGENNFMVTVTAEDGETTMRYHLTVMRSDGHEAPSAPTSFEVEPGDQSATLTWMAPRQIGSTAITGYDWEASAPGQLTRSGTHTDAAVDGVFTLAIASPNLVNGATYTFKVWAVNTKGDPAMNVRGPAATETAKAQPVITMALSSTTIAEAPSAATDTATVTITLSNPSTEAITVTVVEKFAEGDTDMTSQVDIANPTIVIPAGMTAQVAGPDSARITAVDDDVNEDPSTALVQATSDGAIDSDGEAGTDGQQPTTITITDDDTLSEAPALTVRAGNAQLTLEWISPANTGSSPVDKYQYRITAEAGGTLADTDLWVDVAGGAGARTVTIGNLTNDGGAYAVELRAVTAAGNGAAATGSGTPTAN